MNRLAVILIFLFISSCKSNSIHFENNELELYKELKKNIKQSSTFLNFLKGNKIEHNNLKFSKWEDIFCSKAKFYFEEDIPYKTNEPCEKNEQSKFNNIKELNDKGSKYINISVTQKVDNYIIVTIYLKTIGVEFKELVLLYEISPDQQSFKELSSKEPIQ